MLNSISLITKSANILFKVYWFIVRPKTRGVKVLLVNSKKQILMVRLTYYPNTWTFPGGGVHKNEKPEEAVLRECKEEVGIEPKKVTFVAKLDLRQEYKRDTLFIYKAETDSDVFEIDGLEVAEAGWFDVENLPTMGSNAKKILETLIISTKRD